MKGERAKRQRSNSLRCPIYIINSVDNTKFPFYFIEQLIGAMLLVPAYNQANARGIAKMRIYPKKIVFEDSL